MTNNLLTQPDLDQALDATDAAANVSISRIYTALGHMLQSINVALVNDPALRDQLESHLVIIDEESRSLQTSVQVLTKEMTILAGIAVEIRNQRDDALWELKDANERVEDTESTSQANLYNRLLDNIQETFACSRKRANKILDALWDAEDGVDSRTADLLDSIAQIIAEAE